MSMLFQVCEAVLRWVGYNAKERSRHLLSLLNDVRLQLMHPHYLIYSLYQHPLVRNHEPTATYLRNFVVGETPNGICNTFVVRVVTRNNVLGVCKVM